MTKQLTFSCSVGYGWPPAPYSHRIREYYARSPSPEPPYIGEKIYPLFQVLVTNGYYKNHSLSRGFLGMGTCMRPPYAFEWGGGGWWPRLASVVFCTTPSFCLFEITAGSNLIEVIIRRCYNELNSMHLYYVHKCIDEDC